MRLPLASLFVLSTVACAADTTPPAKDAPEATAPAEQPAQQAFLGINTAEVDDALAYHLKLDNDLGILVSEVVPGSAAEKMNLKVFDVIVACDGQPIYTPRAFARHVRGKKIGDPVTLEIRRGAETVKLTGTVRARPAGFQDRLDPARGDFMEPDALRRRIEDMMRRPSPNHNDRPSPRRGRIEKPDGSVMEWSIEGEETK